MHEQQGNPYRNAGNSNIQADALYGQQESQQQLTAPQMLWNGEGLTAPMQKCPQGQHHKARTKDHRADDAPVHTKSHTGDDTTQRQRQDNTRQTKKRKGTAKAWWWHGNRVSERNQ